MEIFSAVTIFWYIEFLVILYYFKGNFDFDF